MVLIRRVRFRTSDGFDLAGILTIPSNPKEFALLMHGITVDKNEWENFYVDLASELSSHDIASMRFDFRGHGESDGTSLDVSVIGDVLDLKAARTEIRRHWTGKLNLIATSFGGGPTLLAAEQWGSQVDKIALIAPVIDYEFSFIHPTTPWGRTWFNKTALAKAYRTGFLPLNRTFRLSTKLLEEFRVIKPYLAISKLSNPVFIIHGDKDTMAPYSVSARCAKEFSNVTLLTLHNADHGYPDYRDETGHSAKSQANKALLLRSVRNFILGTHQ